MILAVQFTGSMVSLDRKGDHMEEIESFEQACRYLKEGAIVFYRNHNKQIYCGIRNDRVHIQGAQLHYVLSFKQFIDMFAQETFYLYEKQTPVEISKEKDEEYYRWQHK